MRVVAGPTVRQAKQAQHWDDRKSQSRCVTRRICPRRSGRTWQERMWNRLNREEQMTSDACRLVRPGAAAQWSPAHNGHVSVLPSGPLARGSSSSGGALVRLEPCEGKLSRTVLRGARARNRSRLPDSTSGRAKNQIPISPSRTSAKEVPSLSPCRTEPSPRARWTSPPRRLNSSKSPFLP
jgi:hypothetical protein